MFNVIIGLILSDGFFQRRKIVTNYSNANYSLGIAQTIKNSNYVCYLFMILGHLCSSVPKIKSQIRNNKTHLSILLQTRSLPCLTEIANMFNSSETKQIPADIYLYLSPVALAHWIAGDGKYVKTGGLTLCTDSYS